MNRAGALLSATPHDRVVVDGFEIESAFLAFVDSFGRRIEVYAARCIPSAVPSPDALSPDPSPASSSLTVPLLLPIVLHLPGGWQTVQEADLLFWARRGFACVAFDWQVGLMYNHDPTRKTRWPAEVVVQSDPIDRLEQAVLPLAIVAAGVVIDWMSADSRCDRERVGVVGISWGGYLSWALNANEPRLRCCAPVFGCGGLFEHRHTHLPAMPASVATLWQREWDAQALADRQLSPVCYVSSTNDFFGRLDSVDHLLNKLSVPHRRSFAVNGNHHVGPGESALVVAWMQQHLCSGVAVPNEPQLSADFHVDADLSQPISEMEIWWAPATENIGDRCWWRGIPPYPRAVACAFARVHYVSGVSVASALRHFSPEPAENLSGLNGKSDPSNIGDEWPHALAGMGYFWALCSTQLHRTDLTIAPLAQDARRGRWRVERTGAGGMSILFRGVSDARWNQHLTGICFAFTLPDSQPATLDVGLTWRDGLTTGEVRSQLPLEKSQLHIRLENFPDWPKHLRWTHCVVVNIEGQVAGNEWIVGPITRLRN